MKWWVVISILLISSFVYSQSCGDHFHSTKHCKSVKLVKKDSLTPVSYKKVSGEYCFEHFEKDVLQLMVTGRFENGQFMDGHEYVFDSIGLLEYIQVYKNGKYSGNGIIEPSKIEPDTINVYCPEGKKDGYWKITGGMRKLPEYCDTCLVEEGEFIANRKNGLWIKYYPSGVIKAKVNYKNGKATGPYELYYPDGRLEEKGDWQPHINQCTFKIYPPELEETQNNKLVFDSIGRPCDMKSSKSYIKTSQCFPPKDVCADCYHKVYNDNGDLWLDGEFKDDQLYNGKEYIYDEYGLLEYIKVYKEGIFAGYGIIE